ncbi:MAG: flagellar protein FliS [Janthinobacterium lividum]
MAAADGATHVGMLVLVYDAIARDLIKAGQAVRSPDIERRCAVSGHALLLLGHLESWVDFLDDPRLCTSLQSFYAMLRTRILQLQSAPNAAEFEKLAQLVCDTRAVWQARERAPLATLPGVPSKTVAQLPEVQSSTGQRIPSIPMSFHA